MPGLKLCPRGATAVSLAGWKSALAVCAVLDHRLLAESETVLYNCIIVNFF